MATQSSTRRATPALASQAEPHHQTSYQCGARESLRRVDRPGKTSAWFGPAKVKAGSLQAETDLRVGGRYRISFTGTDGEYFQVGGIYREIVPNELLVFSWAWHSTPERELLLTISLKPDGAGTLLTLHHEQFFDEAARDGHEKGWTELLGKLERSLA